MLDLTNMAKRLISVVIVMFFLVIVGAFGFYYGNTDGFFRFAMGLFLGSVCACIRVINMDYSVRRAVEMGSSGSSGVKAFVGRYVMTAIFIVASAIFDMFNMWATILGVLSLQAAAYAVPFIFKNIED